MINDSKFYKVFEQSKKYSPKSVRTYVQRLNLWQEHVGDVDVLSLEDIWNGVTELKLRYPLSTIRLSLYALKSYYKLIGRDIYEEINPIKFGINVNDSIREYISPNRLEQIIAQHRPKDFTNPLEVRNYTLFLTFVNTGALLEEVSNLRFLRFEDFRLTTDPPYIKINANTKKERNVNISNEFSVYADCALRFWYESLTSSGIKKPEFVFISMRRAYKIYNRLIQHIINKYGATPSQLRNSFMSRLQEKNIEPKIIARTLGITEYRAGKKYIFKAINSNYKNL